MVCWHPQVSDTDALEVALRLEALADPVRIKLLSPVLAAGSGGVHNVDLARASCTSQTPRSAIISDSSAGRDCS